MRTKSVVPIRLVMIVDFSRSGRWRQVWQAHALGLAPVDVIGGVMHFPKFPFLGFGLEGGNWFKLFIDLPLLAVHISVRRSRWIAVTSRGLRLQLVGRNAIYHVCRRSESFPAHSFSRGDNSERNPGPRRRLRLHAVHRLAVAGSAGGR